MTDNQKALLHDMAIDLRLALITGPVRATVKLTISRLYNILQEEAATERPTK